MVRDDVLDDLRVRIYEGSGTPVLIAPGLHYAGADDPRLDRFCRILAAAGHRVIAPFIPTSLVPLLSGLGILALRVELETLKKLKLQTSLLIPEPDSWNGKATISAQAGGQSIDLSLLPVGVERDWARTGTARSAAPLAKR